MILLCVKQQQKKDYYRAGRFSSESKDAFSKLRYPMPYNPCNT